MGDNILITTLITGHGDCPLWDDDDGKCWFGLKCPEWYKSKTGGYRHCKTGYWGMRRPKKCPAKKGIMIKLKDGR